MEKKGKSYPLAWFGQKYEKNVPITNNDGVSLVQVFSSKKVADTRIALNAPKSRAIVVYALKDKHSTCAISKECVC